MPDEFNDLFFGHSLVVLRAKLKFERLKTLLLETERTKMTEIDDDVDAISLTRPQHEVTKQALEIYIENLRIGEREGFYSEINANRLAVALTVLTQLKGAS